MKHKTLLFFIFIAGMLFIAGCWNKSDETQQDVSQEQPTDDNPAQIFEEDSEEIEDIEDIDVPLEEEDIL